MPNPPDWPREWLGDEAPLSDRSCSGSGSILFRGSGAVGQQTTGDWPREWSSDWGGTGDQPTPPTPPSLHGSGAIALTGAGVIARLNGVAGSGSLRFVGGGHVAVITRVSGSGSILFAGSGVVAKFQLPVINGRYRVSAGSRRT